jgi:hypothetical protein
MLVAIGKGIELDVDVTRFNSEVHDHILRTGLRNLLMDAHASATAKADPDNYVKRSREMAENKLASLYASVVRAQTIGGPKTASDPISQVIMRLARKAIVLRPDRRGIESEPTCHDQSACGGICERARRAVATQGGKNRRARKRPSRTSASKKAPGDAHEKE